MAWRIVDDAVDGVEAEPVHVVLGQPEQRIVNKEIANRTVLGAVEVVTVSPGSAVPVGEELGRIHPEVISFGTKMVVNDIEQHRDAAKVSGLDQRLQIFGTAVG